MEDPFNYGNCVACISSFVIKLRYIKTSRTKKYIPLLFCLECNTLNCKGNYKEDDNQLIADTHYNLNPTILQIKSSKFKDLLHSLNKLIPLEHMYVGEIGCNVGSFINSCKEYGLNCTGYDLNKYMILEGKKKFPDCNLKNMKLENDNIIFDMIFAIDVFDRLKNPDQTLLNIINKLRCKGYIYITVQRFDISNWNYLKKPEMESFNISHPFRDIDVHINHFSINGIKKFGERLGLYFIKDFVDPNNLSDNWPINGILFQKINDQKFNIISFPRSGQHLTEKVIRYLCEQYGLPFSYCEYYNCCNSVPCLKNCVYQKNHDFDLNLSIKITDKYLVLYRKDPILQLEACYRNHIFDIIKKEYIYEDLLQYIIEKFDYYKKFIEKWTQDQNKKNIFCMTYEDIIQDPINNYQKIFNFFYPDISINTTIFQQLTEQTFHGSKIKLLNKLDDKIYQKLKIDLISKNINITNNF